MTRFIQTHTPCTALITAFDTDNDQAWNLDEYSDWRRVLAIVVSVLPHLTSISEGERELLYSEFAIAGMDKDGDGKINLGELQAFLSLAEF